MSTKWKLWAMLIVLFVSFNSSEVYGLNSQSVKGNDYLASLNFFSKSKKNPNKNRNMVADNYGEKGSNSSKKENCSIFGGKGANIEECPEEITKAGRAYGCTQTTISTTKLQLTKKMVPSS